MEFLIVDDERTICNGTARRLRNMGLAEIKGVYCAYSGEEALEIIGSRVIHVMLTDIRMGDLNGLGLIHRAKALQPCMICAVITAYGHFEYAQEAIREGVEDFLVKPCSESDMRRCITKIIQKLNADAPNRAQDFSRRLLNAAAQPDGSFRACAFASGQCVPERVYVAAWQHETHLPPTTGWRQLSDDFAVVDDAERDALIAQGVPAAFSDAGDCLKAMLEQAKERLYDNRDPEALLCEVDAYVDAHLYKDVDMAAIANQMNLSYSYFSRLFHEVKGDSFIHYLTVKRMQEACRLMQHGAHLTDISDRLGYQSTANFTRAFRKEYGMPPSRWLSLHPIEAVTTNTPKADI